MLNLLLSLKKEIIMRKLLQFIFARKIGPKLENCCRRWVAAESIVFIFMFCIFDQLQNHICSTVVKKS